DGSGSVGGECSTGRYITTSSGAIPDNLPSTAITNADQGVMYAWNPTFYNSSYYNGGGTLYTVQNLTFVSGGSANTIQLPIGGSQTSLQPVLQAQDNSFIGTATIGSVYSMIGFDQSGNLKLSVPNYYPLKATSDGGVIAQSADG